jgi:hypothetical protein
VKRHDVEIRTGPETASSESKVALRGSLFGSPSAILAETLRINVLTSELGAPPGI